ncbi:Helicase C-terminal [Penicillium samsonianum]|uniref:Helicase C-terminal n=1 Tax=Penicillium samsonianum TaxID=1882272 RepID=UPI0025469C62|nr:Helicase C-terminal [Penicillium samsonianum]KAJ6118684.1 Helicase C-terminal [Penicillium samsonianum]
MRGLIPPTHLSRETGHTMAGVDSATLTMGADIPSLAITTDEMRYTRPTQVDHDRSFHRAGGPPLRFDRQVPCLQAGKPIFENRCRSKER